MSCFHLRGPAALVVCLLAILAQACGRSSLVEAAASGDGARLRREISLAQASGELDATATRQIAAAVLTRELRSARELQAVQLVQRISSCVPQIASALAERAAGDDQAAVAATLSLLDAGEVRADEVLDRPGIRQGKWRAVLARALLRPAEHDLRRRLFGDADERVRRGALRAARLSPDVDDLEVLLEAVRLDPDEECRRRAALAVGAVGGSRAVMGLRDRWATSDADTRLAIVESWAAPRAATAGGVRELEWAAVAAAAELAAIEGAPGPQQLGRALVLRYVVEGSLPERRLAIAHADPADARAREALEKAAAGGEVRVLALARLAEHQPSRASALRRLRQIAKQRGSLGDAARQALVRLGDAGVASVLSQQLHKGIPTQRRAAAMAFVEAGAVDDAAAALADPEAMVRADVACAILRAAPE